MRAALLAIPLIAAALLGSRPATACSVDLRDLSPAEVKAAARESHARAAVIVDAVVIVPMIFQHDGRTPYRTPFAVLRAVKVLKGVRRRTYLVTYVTSCDTAFERKGERSRILLVGGPKVFSAKSPLHGVGSPDSRDQALFHRTLDSLVGGAPPKGFSRWPGLEVSPPPEFR